uniref:Uncharacterized protein n=1 Tax=Sphaeramia orbicularis TaxID=375764 RepID=A0A672ZQQ6_9TELE
MLPVQPAEESDCADEELGSISVGTSIGHGQILIRKLLSINGFASSSIVVGEVTALTKTEQSNAHLMNETKHWKQDKLLALAIPDT